MEKVDSIIKRFIHINEDQIPYQSIDSTFSCQSESSGEFNFENENFKQIEKIEWFGDVAVFYSVYYNKGIDTIAFAIPCQLEDLPQYVEQ